MKFNQFYKWQNILLLSKFISFLLRTATLLLVALNENVGGSLIFPIGTLIQFHSIHFILLKTGQLQHWMDEILSPSYILIVYMPNTGESSFLTLN